MLGRDEMSGWDDESCDIMRHHTTSCDREWKGVGSGWCKASFDRRRCGRETRWREWERKRKAGGSRRHKGFPLQILSFCSNYYMIYIVIRKCDLFSQKEHDHAVTIIKMKKGVCIWLDDCGSSKRY